MWQTKKHPNKTYSEIIYQEEKELFEEKTDQVERQLYEKALQKTYQETGCLPTMIKIT